MIGSPMALRSPGYVYQVEPEGYDSLLERISFPDAPCVQVAPSFPADLSALQSGTEPPRLRHPDEISLLSFADHAYPDAFGNDAFSGWHYFPQMPLQSPFTAVYDYSHEPAFIRKRNERERQRVKCVNEGYARLRQHLPQEVAEKRLSKVETLRAAISYIKELQSLLRLHGDYVERQPAGNAVSQATGALEAGTDNHSANRVTADPKG
ncbi:achaete-scute homolog 5-like [Mobula birostris]|uniref:achaete-scute homolog 5-like n=1 Tax=Mobula birostris TaxID=1983395 RepID=UPI003B28CB9A